jgi:ectoine hydroxylase-related dioxygenase (phytanoyl-CoA dioxygenase family)
MSSFPPWATMTTLHITADDRARGSLPAADVERAVDAFRDAGYVVLEDCLSLPTVDELRGAYMRALRDKIDRLQIAPVSPDDRGVGNDSVRIDFRPEGGNHDLNRWNMHLPSRLPFLVTDVVANPLAVPIVDALLGADCVLPIIASDTPLPRSGFQNIHQDASAFRVTVNIPLVDFHEDNAPIEVWPRTHRPEPQDPSGRSSPTPLGISEGDLSRIRASVPSERLLLRAGSFLIRDQRLVHRGTANRSTEPRPMLSLLYFPAPEGVPHPALSRGSAWLALRARERARRPDRFDSRLLDAGNTVGRFVEYLSGTDRDHRRPIPEEVWDALSPRARSLLRFARPQGRAQEAIGLPSVRASMELMSHVGKLLVARGESWLRHR